MSGGLNEEEQKKWRGIIDKGVQSLEEDLFANPIIKKVLANHPEIVSIINDNLEKATENLMEKVTA